MRLTRETLYRIARETALKRSFSDPDLVAVYLTGSLRTESPYLGGAADIDLVCVHSGQPRQPRELLPLTPEVHLDILHRAQGEYERPKQLRLHPWLGPELYDAQLLYSSQHFFAFLQAGVRDRFLDPSSVLTRCRTMWSQSRRLWSELQPGSVSDPGPLLSYLEAVHLAAQSLILLNGAPLAERRLLLEFPARAEAAGVPGLAAGLLGLLGAAQADPETLKGFLPEWERAFVAASGRRRVDDRLAPPRLQYYRGAFEALLENGPPMAILWPLLLTWSLSAAVLPVFQQSGWRTACKSLDLAGPAFEDRLEGLDRFLDAVEEVLDAMAASQGLEASHS
jgi:hypothetical protein